MQPVEFTLEINSADNPSWQGTVKTSQRERPFKSELELLFFIQEELEKHGAKPLVTASPWRYQTK